MTLRVANLRLGLDEPEAALPEHLGQALGIRADELGTWRILRKSLDARNKEALQFVYSAEVMPSVEDEERLLRHARRRRPAAVRVERHQEPAFHMPPAGTEPLPQRPARRLGSSAAPAQAGAPP